MWLSCVFSVFSHNRSGGSADGIGVVEVVLVVTSWLDSRADTAVIDSTKSDGVNFESVQLSQGPALGLLRVLIAAPRVFLSKNLVSGFGSQLHKAKSLALAKQVHREGPL